MVSNELVYAHERHAMLLVNIKIQVKLLSLGRMKHKSSTAVLAVTATVSAQSSHISMSLPDNRSDHNIPASSTRHFYSAHLQSVPQASFCRRNNQPRMLLYHILSTSFLSPSPPSTNPTENHPIYNEHAFQNLHLIPNELQPSIDGQNSFRLLLL
jgi:hypothetical protein